MASRAVAIDVGSHTVKVLAVKAGKRGLTVTAFASVPREEAESELRRLGISLKGVVAGVGGRDMILRYTQVPPSPDWQLKNLMDLELQDLQGQSGGDLSADYNLLPAREDDDSGMDTVLMALVRNEALERTSDLVQGAGGSIDAHVPTCIALYNAFLKCGPAVEEDEVTAVVGIGRDTMDIALLRGTDLLFARNLGTGGKVLDDAIAGAFNVSAGKAEKLKVELLDLDPMSRGRFASSQAEKVTMAAGGASSAIVSGIQSSLAFCQSQTKIAGLRLDRVFLCGGSANARGMKSMLRESLRCPVEVFDPFERCDLGELSPQAAEELSQMRAEAVPALGLAAARLDPALYNLEILPERVKRKQRFLQRTLFDIAAAAVAAGLLAVLFLQGKDRLEAATKIESTVRSQAGRIRSVHEAASTLQAENEEKRTLVEAMAQRTLPLDGGLRVLRALADTMKPEFWLESIELKLNTERGAGGARSAPRQVFVVKGKGKPIGGIDLGEQYRAFLDEFTKHPLIKPKDAAAQNVVPARRDLDLGVTEFTLTVDLLAEPEAKEN
ncbi:MAG: pilus assembly protein PilM [Planctomycetota bacterium]